MTRRRYFAVGGLLAVILCAGVGIAMLIPPSPGVTKANFDRIEIGMTRDRVIEIFGQSSVDAFGGQVDPMEVWAGDNLWAAFVTFREDKVIASEWVNFSRRSETIFEKIRRWLHL